MGKTTADYRTCQKLTAKRHRRDVGDTVWVLDDVMEDEEEAPAEDDDDDDGGVNEEPSAWPGEWTEASARQFCEDYILQKPSVQACAQVPNVDFDTPIHNCVLDIKLDGSTTATETHVESIKIACELEMLRNTTLWEEDGEGGFRLPVTYTQVTCPSECSNHGDCVDGACVCASGYSGFDCSMEDALVPQIYRLPNSGHCDLLDWTCRAIKVFGDNIFETGRTKCRVTHTQVTRSGNVTVGTYDLDGEYDRLETAICPLPNRKEDAQSFGDAPVVADIYNISLSNDGEHFGNEFLFAVYNSQCTFCTNKDYMSVECMEQSVCFMDGECYRDGETSPAASCLTCDVAENTDTWTVSYDDCYINDVCYPKLVEHPQNTCYICDPDKSKHSWTRKAIPECKPKPPTPTPALAPTLLSTDIPNNEESEYLEIYDPCRGVEELVSHPFNCTMYIHCHENGIASEVKLCPSQSVWNNSTKECDIIDPLDWASFQCESCGSSFPRWRLVSLVLLSVYSFLLITQ